MKKYKLTTQKLTTHNGFQWIVGKKETTSGEGGLCDKGFLHYYHHPLLAVLLNSIHADIKNPRLFEVKAKGKHLDDKSLKGGCTEMTLIKEIELPVITKTQKIAFAVLCAKKAYKEIKWNKWANDWLTNKDRTSATAHAAAHAATAHAAADTTAAYAARIAARIAYAANAASAARVATYAAYAAHATYGININLITIAKKAMKY